MRSMSRCPLAVRRRPPLADFSKRPTDSRFFRMCLMRPPGRRDEGCLGWALYLDSDLELTLRALPKACMDGSCVIYHSALMWITGFTHSPPISLGLLSPFLAPPGPQRTSSLGMDLGGGSAAPLASSEYGLEVADTKARAVIQAAAESGCMAWRQKGVRIRMGRV